jgi:uncharacterized membrane protein YccC
MTWPTRQAMVAASGSCLAVIMALYVAFFFDLPNPWWAMASVFLAQPSRPLTGAIWAKASYRVAGTVMGGLVSIVIVPNFASYPEMLFLALGSWLAVCVFGGAFDRTPRSYVFYLAGYTATFITMGSALNPAIVFDLAVARVEEIVIGVVALAVAQSLIFPTNVGPIATEKLDCVMGRARGWIRDSLSSSIPTPAPRGLAASLTEINLLATDWRFEGSFSKTRQQALWALEERLLMLLPAVTAVEDRILSLQEEDRNQFGITTLLAQAAGWAETTDGSEPGAKDRLLERITHFDEAIGPAPSLAEMLRFSLAARLSVLVRLWAESLQLSAIATGRIGRMPPNLSTIVAGASPRSLHTDGSIALVSALVACMTTFAVGMFSVSIQWSDGGLAVMFAALCLALFSPLDDPTPVLWQLCAGLLAILPVAVFYECTVLPLIDGFPLLAVSLLPIVFPLTLLFSYPKHAFLALGGLVGFTLGMALQPTFVSNLPNLLNLYSSAVLGIIFAILGIGLGRVIHPHVAINRLLRLGWSELSSLALQRSKLSAAGPVSRAIDRVGLLTPRLARVEPSDPAKLLRVLEEARLAAALVELKGIRPYIGSNAAVHIDSTLQVLADHFDRLAASEDSELPETVVARLDAAITSILSLEDKWTKRAGLDAALNIRQVLFPAGQPYRPKAITP